MNFLRLIMTLYTSIASLANRLVRWLRSPRGMMRVSIGIIVIGECWQAHLVWRQTLVERMAKRRGDIIERATLIPYSLKRYVQEQIIAWWNRSSDTGNLDLVKN